MRKCVRKHRCTLSSLSLIVRWDGNPTQPGRGAGPTALRAYRATEVSHHKLRAVIDKFLMEKPNITYCPTLELNPGLHARVWSRKYRMIGRTCNFGFVKCLFTLFIVVESEDTTKTNAAL